jgi:hypothetical protein
MKLGGMTWWRYNYGSILQAYALQSELKELGIDDYEIICQYGKKVASISNLKEKIKRIGVRQSLKRIVWKFGLKKLRDRNRNIQSFVDNYLHVSQKEYNEENIVEANNVYDGFVCGSDQIWNPKLTDVNSMYWLTFASKEKLKFSYAPSIGVDKFSDEQKEAIKNNLSSFKGISSREENGTNLINDALGANKCVTVLDPTLLVDRKIWDNISLSENQYGEKYIFVYMLRGTKKQRKLIEEFAKLKGLKIVTMPFLDNEKIEIYDFKFGDIKLWDASPADFITVIRNAEYVFTDSFHCMLFSCMYHRDFYTFPKIGQAQINRMLNFQKLVSASEHMISDEIDVNKIENVKRIDWNYVDSVLNDKRKESEAYLKSVLDMK